MPVDPHTSPGAGRENRTTESLPSAAAGATLEPLADAGYRSVPDADGGGAGRRWWDANAADYLAEHGDFLGPADFVWCPEGLREEDAGLLGDLGGLRVLEVGAGAAQCARWLAGRGVAVVATDVSGGMLAGGRRYDRAAAGRRVPMVQADARRLPFADGSFDVAFTAFGAIPFVPDADRVHAEVARVLRPGGRWVLAVTHPLRWAFPDDPSERGLTANRSYFDRRPYVETGASGAVLYAEYHRTIGDHVTRSRSFACSALEGSARRRSGPPRSQH